MKTKRVKGKQSPWIKKKLLEIRHDRDYHRKKAQISNSKYNWQMYRKLTNCANGEERRLKSEYYCRLIEDAKGDSCRMWKAIKQTLPSNRCEIYAIFSAGKLQTDPTSIAESLNNHFSSIGKKLAKAFSRTLPDQYFACSSNFSLQPVTKPIARYQRTSTAISWQP